MGPTTLLSLELATRNKKNLTGLSLSSRVHRRKLYQGDKRVWSYSIVLVNVSIHCVDLALLEQQLQRWRYSHSTFIVPSSPRGRQEKESGVW